MHLQGLVYILFHVCFHSAAHFSSLSNEKIHQKMDVSSNITGQQQVPVLLQGTMGQPTGQINTLEEDTQDDIYEYITDNIPVATTTINPLREMQEETKFLQLLQGDAADEDDLVDFITVSNMKGPKTKKTDKSSTLEQTAKSTGRKIKKSNDKHVNIPSRKQDRLLSLSQTIPTPRGKPTTMDLTTKTHGSSRLNGSRIRHKRGDLSDIGSGESGDGSGDSENETTIRISTKLTSMSSQTLSSTAPGTFSSIPNFTSPERTEKSSSSSWTTPSTVGTNPLTKRTPTSPKPSEESTTTPSKQESTFLETLEKQVPLSLKFNASYKDLKSTFEKKKIDLENQIFTTFNSTAMEGLLGVEITDFREGSIIIDFNLIFALKVFLNNSGNSNVTLTKIKEVLSGNKTLRVEVDNRTYGSDEQYALNELQKIGQLIQDPCMLDRVIDICAEKTKTREYTCEVRADKGGVECVSKCVNWKCNGHGTCSVPSPSFTPTCTCYTEETATQTITYSGVNCAVSSAAVKLDIVIYITTSVGGALLIVVAITIVLVVIWRRRYWNVAKRSKYHGLHSDKMNTNDDTASDTSSETRSRMLKKGEYVYDNEVYQQGADGSLYGPGYSMAFQVNLDHIDPKADYSIKRPQIYPRPSSLRQAVGSGLY